MPLDPVIAQGIRGIELQNPLESYARVQQIRSAQNQNALAQYQLGAAQREESTQNALSQAFQAAFDPTTGSYDMNKLRSAAIGAGAGSRLPVVEKQMGELRTQQLAQNKAEAEAVTQKLAQSRALLDTIDPNDPSAPQRFMAWHELNHTDPVLGPLLQRMGVTADQSRARITKAAAQGPAAFADLIAQSREGQTKFAERFKPARATPAETEEIVMRLQDPSLPPASRQALESRLRILTTREPKESREPALRTQQVTMNDGTLGIMNMDTGQVTPASLGGAPVKGKPSAFAEKNAAQRKQMALDLDRAIVELTDASKDGGLIDQSTGSGAGRLVDIGAGFVGTATPGAIATGKLAPIADLALKMVTRFEGPQSDKDTKSYKEAAGQLADSTLPNKIRKEAAKTVVRLMKERKGQFVTKEMEAEGAGAAPTTKPSLDSIFGPK